MIGGNCSLRDPAGRLVVVDGRVLRIVAKPAVDSLLTLLRSPTAKQFTDRGALIETRIAEDIDIANLDCQMGDNFRIGHSEPGIVVEHPRVDFPSFPHEWPVEMLHAAARLTLELAEAFLVDGIGLKDADPRNILFRGPRPVFVDILSFEKRDPGDPVWLPYAQFVRAFLLPLLVNKHFGIPLSRLPLAGHDGLRPQDVYPLLGLARRFLPPFITLVSLPVWLSKTVDKGNTAIYKKKRRRDTESSRFILQSLFDRLNKLTDRVMPAGGESVWSSYMSSKGYSSEEFSGKKSFIETALAETRPKKILDVGCNTGYFSLIAARQGARVVAIDSDPVVVGETWRQALKEDLDILPLVVNLASPTPAFGWRNRESASFLERSFGNFDTVMMLAVVHHMLVTDQIPLHEIAGLAAELTKDLLLIEFVEPNDPLFQSLTLGRDYLYQGLTAAAFETCFRRHFDIIRDLRLCNGTRSLYAMKKKLCQ